MAIRTKYSSSDEIGVFTKLTNSYCIISVGASQTFFSTFEHELEEHIPVFQTTIGGGSTIGCMSVGNSKGLLLPSTTTDKELKHIRNSLPDDVVVRRLEDSPTALGNCCSTNDYVCLIHPELDREIEEMLADTLDVEVFRETIGDQNLVYPRVSIEELDELSSLIQVPLVAGTVNRGSNMIGSGLVANDWTAFTGMATTSTEIALIEQIFHLQGTQEDTDIVDDLRMTLLDTVTAQKKQSDS